MTNKTCPQPIFDQPNFLAKSVSNSIVPEFLREASKATQDEFTMCAKFLLCYRNSPDTFNAYRREIERYFHWCHSIAHTDIVNINREKIQEYIEFVKKPYPSWVGQANAPRFKNKQGKRQPNPKWRPFITSIPKALRKQNNIPEKINFVMSQSALKALLASLSTFYTFLQQEQHTAINPVRLIRQKNQLIQKSQAARITRKLTNQQWLTIITTISDLCLIKENHQRHLFILSCLYLLGLRISELAPNHLHTPSMGDFVPDEQGRWWFHTVGKGNKYREIAVPDAMLEALRQYRLSLQLPPLPIRKEMTPLIPKTRGQGGLGIRQIRNMVQICFDHAIEVLRNTEKLEEANDLCAATVHWLRHTSITADIKTRPREHVRDDAGHQNANITDRYIDSDRSARHLSAKNKTLIPETDQT